VPGPTPGVAEHPPVPCLPSRGSGPAVRRRYRRGPYPRRGRAGGDVEARQPSRGESARPHSSIAGCVRSGRGQHAAPHLGIGGGDELTAVERGCDALEQIGLLPGRGARTASKYSSPAPSVCQIWARSCTRSRVEEPQDVARPGAHELGRSDTARMAKPPPSRADEVDRAAALGDQLELGDSQSRTPPSWHRSLRRRTPKPATGGRQRRCARAGRPSAPRSPGSGVAVHQDAVIART